MDRGVSVIELDENLKEYRYSGEDWPLLTILKILKKENYKFRVLFLHLIKFIRSILVNKII